MLYNKNSVRKTNDKKILHKVGKQWKVVSVALLMAIGGGAAVAATNNTSANADANPYTMNAQTSAEVQSLEANPNVGQSSAPAKQSSKAASASTSAPTMPSLSLNPDPSLDGHNADAQYNRVKQGYDKAVIKYYGNKVQSYVNFVNGKYSASASSVNSNYDVASSTQANDKSLASSYAATASGKNWSAEVSNIASAKSGIDASAYIETVGANVQSNTNEVSDFANALSGASAIGSYATLISDINNNQVVSGEYYANYLSASANQHIYNNGYNTAETLYSNFVNDSANNESAYLSASAESVANSANDEVAVANSGIDASFVSSIAKSGYGNSAVQYSNASKAVSIAASDFNSDNQNGFGNLAGFDVSGINNALSAVSSADSVINNLNSSIASLNGSATSVNNKSLSSFAKVSANASAKVALASNAANNIPNISKYDGTVSGIMNMAVSDAVNDNLISGANSVAYSSLANKFIKNHSSIFNGILNGINSNTPVSLSVSANGNFSARVGNNTPYSGNAKDVLSVMASSVSNSASFASASLSGAISVANSALNTNNGSLTSLNNQLSSASTVVSSANDVLYGTANGDDSDAYRVLSDTATQQQYGSLKNSYDAVMNSAKANSAKYSMDVSSADDALNVAKANKNSADNAVNNLALLGNYPTLDDIENGGTVTFKNGTQSSFAPLVPYASASAFYDANTNDVANMNADNENNAALISSKPSAESSAVSAIVSDANKAGSYYTSASNASEAYAKYTDADFVLASSYANYYETKSASDQSAFNSASNARTNFYNTYAGNDYGSDADMLNSAESDEPNAAGLANGNATYVLKHEPHVVTVIKQLVMHRNPNYNDKTDTPADAKLAVINKGTHLMVTNVGFDKHGNTRLYVDYKGTKGFITGLRNYVTDSYLIPGQEYKVTFGRTANEYKGLQFNKANATKLSVKKNQTVTGTAVLNDDGEHFLGLTRLQLSNGNYVTTLDTFIKNATPLNENGQPAPQKGAYFWNGQDTTFLNK